MPKYNPKIFLVYGFSLDQNESIELLGNCEIFNIPFYGCIEDNELRYVGIKFGEIDSIFDHLKTTNQTSLQITNLKPTDEIIETMNKLYPKKTSKCQAFLQDIYTSHYVDGFIACGHFVQQIYSYDEENDDNNKHIEYLDNVNDVIVEHSNKEIEIYSIAHNLTASIMASHFVGIRLGDDFVNFNFNDNNEPAHNFYKLLTTTYNYDNNLNIKFKQNYLASGQQIAFVPTMCYCCT
jgi:hypothetical protein